MAASIPLLHRAPCVSIIHPRSIFIINLLYVICLPAGPNVLRLHSSRCCAFYLSFPYPSSIIQSMSLGTGLPLSLFHSILPFILSVCRATSYNVPYPVLLPCSNYVHQRFFSSTSFNTFSFAFLLCPYNPLHPSPYPHLATYRILNKLRNLYDPGLRQNSKPCGILHRLGQYNTVQYNTAVLSNLF